MATQANGDDGNTEPCLFTKDEADLPPTIIDVLLARASQPTLVSDADDPGLPVIATTESDTAKGDNTHARTGMPLAVWVGDPVAQAIITGIDHNELGGVTDGWRWLVAAMEPHRVVICERIATPSGEELPPNNLNRIRRLVAVNEAALAVNSDLDLEVVLQRIVDVARDIVPSHYAALGVADERGKIIQFITSGITAEQRAEIGPLPEGHGLLGALIEEGEPLLIPDIAADPRSSGFPPHHPPMNTLLGVPIKLNEVVLGDLYLTERSTGTPFTVDDLETVELLASHAARAIERARLYDTIRRGRQRAEEQRDQIQTILDNLPSAVLIVSQPEGAVEMANASAYRMIVGDDAPSGFMMQHLREFRMFEPEGLPLAHALRPGIRALNGLTVRNQQLLLETRAGLRIPVLMQATPLYDPHGNVARAVLVFQDITKLREAEQLKDDFLSLISHEFRTPLTAIHGGAYLLSNQHDALDAATQQGILTDIVAESKRLDQMLRNILSLAAIMAGKLTAETEPVLLGPLARAVIAEISEHASKHTFVVELPLDLPPIEADPDLLSQVLRNLYENAVKYAPDGGEVTTFGFQGSSTVTISVRDQGIGIAPEHSEHVFERFRRLGAKPTVRGMGLGLYLSRHLVEAQGGTIRANSSCPNTGTTFSVELPIARGWLNEATPGHPPHE